MVFLTMTRTCLYESKDRWWYMSIVYQSYCSASSPSENRSQQIPYEAIDELFTTVANHDGVEAFSEVFCRGVHEPCTYRHCYVYAWDGSCLVGLLAYDQKGTAEIAVAPQYRRLGIGTGLVAQAIRDSMIPPPYYGWAHGDHRGARMFAQALGAEPVRVLENMQVDCAPGSAHHRLLHNEYDNAMLYCQHHGLEVLSYHDATMRYGQDYVDSQWLRVNNDAFSWHPEQGHWSDDHLATAKAASWFDPHFLWMLWQEDKDCRQHDDKNPQVSQGNAAQAGSSSSAGRPRCVGFHWAKIAVEEKEKPVCQRTGEVYVVCLAQEMRGKGCGRVITLLGIGGLLEYGVATIELYVDGDNKPAIATYQALGFHTNHRDISYRYSVEQDGL